MGIKKEKKLGEVFTLQRGFDITKKEQSDGPYPVVSSSGINSYHNEYKVKGPGVVIGRKGTLGTSFYLEGDYWPHDTSLWVKDFKGNNPKFIYYFLKALPHEKLDSGSANPTLNRNFVHLLEASIPNPNEQVSLAQVLTDIDKKIDLNNKINIELEAMAKLIYDYWFVQFDFPSDSPENKGKPYKSSGGKMVYNEVLKREIPDGWDVNFLTDWIESDKTGDWGKESEQGNYTLQVDCIRGADINGLNGKGKVKSPNRFILEKNSHKLLAPFDLIVEISGGSPTQSTGRMTFLTPEMFERFNHPLICSNFCKAISLKDNNYFYNFVYQWNSLYSNGVLFGWEGKTSGIKNLLFDAFVSKHNVCKPPERLAKEFSKVIEPIQQKKQKALKENAELESLRDWLLPMLMNGQVTVKNTK
jgi:type I restriction enzyme S subunit